MWGNRVFTGTIPRMTPRQLPEAAATVAENVWLDRRRPRPVPALARVAGVPAFSNAVRTIYRFDDDRWFAWDEDVDVVPAPVREDTTRRTIWTGDDYPKHTSTAIMQGGGFVSPGPPISRRLGVAAPASAPNVQLGALATTADMTAESHAWVYTFLTDLDEEGPPSLPSAVLTRNFDDDGMIQPVTITMRTAAQGATGANRKRLYRTATSATGVTIYRLVATVLIAQADYIDTVLTADLGDELITTTWDAPPADLKGLLALPNGILAGFRGRDIYFSEPYQPHAWPTDYIVTVDEDVVGLDAFGTNVVVGTTGKPYLIFGAHPQTITSARMELNQACVSRGSFAYLDKQGVAFASPDGLVLVGPSGGELISKALFDRADWQALGPADFRAVYHDGAYLAFTPTRTIAFDPDMGGVVEIADDGVKAVFADRERDTIYVVDSGNRLSEWKTDPAADDALRTMRWRSRLHVGPARNFPAAQVIADAYPVTLRILGDGEDVFNGAVGDEEPFRLRADKLFANWQYEVSGTNTVEEVRIGAIPEMLGG